MKSTLTGSLSILLIATAANAQDGSFVTSGAGCPASISSSATNINAADDAVNGPHALGWSFTYAGGAGSTTSIDIAPNGFIYLEAGTITTSRCCNGVSTTGVPIASFLSATPSIACLGLDLNATAGGAIYFETNGVDEATITWDHVPEFGQAGTNTVVCTLRGDGSITLEYNNISFTNHRGLIGYSPGGAAVDAGSMDFSTLPIVGAAGEAIYEGFLASTFDLSNSSVIFVPTAGSYTVTPGATPPLRDPISISSAVLPNLGSTFVIDINGAPASSVWNGVFFGDAAIGPFPLTGAPGCNIYTNASLGGIGGLGTTSVSLVVPTTITLIGTVLETQGVSLVAGINARDIVVSNLGTLTVGDGIVCTTIEDFEGTVNGAGNYPATWADGGGSAQWSAFSGPTGSSNTGPVTGAFGGTQYMYCETSGSGGSGTFNMNTRVYTAAEIPSGQIAFRLSRLGATIGSMDVFMDDGINPPVLLANFTGAAGDWNEEVLTLPSVPAGGASFQFNYTAGGSFTGDIAIDNFCTL